MEISSDYLAHIPDEDVIRRELARNLRERDLLKKLLRLSRDKADLAAIRKGGRPESQSA
ncbi:MAG: hypothetical protein ACYTGL_12390 [Planctomycetota bacterium]